MSYFRYKTIRRDGQISSGVAELPFDAAAGAHLHFEGRGLTVIDVQRINEIYGWTYSLLSKCFRRRVRREELIELLNNLGVMIRSGIPILTAIEDVTSYSENPTLVKVAEDLRLGLERGEALADAMDVHKDIFPDAVRHTIRIGEEAGRLDRAMMDAATHLERVRQIASSAQKSLIYPFFVLTALLGATGFWIYFVIPTVSDLFNNLNVELPAVTLFVLSGAAFLENNFRWMLIAAVVVLTAGFLGLKFNPWLRRKLHRVLTVLPIVGRIVKASNLAFIAEYFSLFISSGFDTLKSLEIIQRTAPNEMYREKIRAAREGLIRGSSLTEEFARHKLFPGFVVRMIHAGELSGNLAEQLQLVATDYRRRLKDMVERLAEVTKPMTILVIGALFLFIIAALFLPIYHLVGEVSTRATY